MMEKHQICLEQASESTPRLLPVVLRSSQNSNRTTTSSPSLDQPRAPTSVSSDNVPLLNRTQSVPPPCHLTVPVSFRFLRQSYLRRFSGYRTEWRIPIPACIIGKNPSQPETDSITQAFAKPISTEDCGD